MIVAIAVLQTKIIQNVDFFEETTIIYRYTKSAKKATRENRF